MLGVLRIRKKMLRLYLMFFFAPEGDPLTHPFFTPPSRSVDYGPPRFLASANRRRASVFKGPVNLTCYPFDIPIYVENKIVS